MIKQFRSYDNDLKRIILDEQYLFTFMMHDGFSDRSLKAEILIDYEYNLTLHFRCNVPTSKKYVFEEFEELVQEKASSEIISFLEKLLKIEYLKLKDNYWYETFTIDDIGGQQFLINFNSPTFNIHIVDGLPKEYFKTLAEEHLYLFNEHLKNWIETKYNNLSPY